ncbi:hypothetical protein Dsin_019592 [Dipteronia sinensis]|uniref:Uncharacterized protein n=1 Tax=Dipteronia sinensis TaxID=43782 RepID=A0AAE0A8Z9_9ROSI|nr:hypothetical protein Dsin_019592 [Dipteronia sinensis]
MPKLGYDPRVSCSRLNTFRTFQARSKSSSASSTSIPHDCKFANASTHSTSDPWYHYPPFSPTTSSSFAPNAVVSLRLTMSSIKLSTQMSSLSMSSSMPMLKNRV